MTRTKFVKHIFDDIKIKDCYPSQFFLNKNKTVKNNSSDTNTCSWCNFSCFRRDRVLWCKGEWWAICKKSKKRATVTWWDWHTVGKVCTILPPVCVVCRGKRYSKNKGRGTSLPERLTRCELSNGGLLLKAAKQKQDDNLLTQTNNKGLCSNWGTVPQFV